MEGDFLIIIDLDVFKEGLSPFLPDSGEEFLFVFEDYFFKNNFSLLVGEV